MYCHGRFVAQAMGEHTFYSRNNLMYGKACESAKSNALMRCCKDLGVASSLWDPQVWWAVFRENMVILRNVSSVCVAVHMSMVPGVN